MSQITSDHSLAPPPTNTPQEQQYSDSQVRKLMQALQAFEQGDFSVTDTLNSRQLLQTLRAYRRGNFSIRLPEDKTGIAGEIATVFNDCINFQENLMKELARVAKAVGQSGCLSQRIVMENANGDWSSLIDHFNHLMDNQNQPLLAFTAVVEAIMKGDLEQSMPLDVEGRSLRGDYLKIAKATNQMINQLQIFASEVIRVSREVGRDGKLGGQANISSVTGLWANVTESVNEMANNLTAQVRGVATVTRSVAKGDLSRKITVDAKGEILELKNTINSMVDQLNDFSQEVTRVAREVGTEGQLGGQAQVRSISGTWKELTDSVNTMASNLTNQVRDIAKVSTAVANGDLTQKITVTVQGEILQLKNTINTMVDQLSVFSKEVTRVAKEVGTDGILGGKAKVEGVRGTWRDLTNNVNTMADNLTNQVRTIARVATAVAQGDLSKSVSIEAQGEILELTNTINTMVEQLGTFSTEVTRVAREVGIEGKLGGKATVQGAAGIWRDLTDNVNELADNLTRQVRAIATVATAVTNGNLTGSIVVGAKGEVETLKNNINRMIRSLADTTAINNEQDWLKTNLTRFTNMMQGKRNVQLLAQNLVSELAPLVKAQHVAFYLTEQYQQGDITTPVLKLIASYGYQARKGLANTFSFGESLVGQCALEKEKISISHVPDDYIKINSGLGEAKPTEIIVIPAIFEQHVRAVIELASFESFSAIEQTFLEQLLSGIGIVINSVTATTRTEALLKESQQLSQELQNQQEELQVKNEQLEQQAQALKASEEELKSQQEELQETNEELEEKAKLLTDQKVEVELKNTEVKQAKVAIEQKAEELALTSKYKSEFLANMSHELRTPLNSLLVLSEVMLQNRESNLSANQLKSIDTIHSSGEDLLNLIDDILDLAKIESGKMSLNISEVAFTSITNSHQRSFQQLADNKQLHFSTHVDPQLPSSIRTDENRLQQVLKNLLSNAMKFTLKGQVSLDIRLATQGWRADHPILRWQPQAVSFAVTDTGVGIAPDKQRIIFEAFQQEDGTTSRKYGGTGLGLSISRELVKLLGGELSLKSIPEQGSTFTLYLPLQFSHPLQERHNNKPALPTAILPNHEQPICAIDHPIEPAFADDRNQINRDQDRVVLIIEDDVTFAQILLDSARQQGFKGIVALQGDTGLTLAIEHQPDAVVLDLHLPVLNGWTVLDRLKHNSHTRHIPVHIASVEEARQRSLRSGAISFLKKPLDAATLQTSFQKMAQFITDGPRHLLVVEDDPRQQQSIKALIGNGDVIITPVNSAEAALHALAEKTFHCMVLDLMLPDRDGFSLIEAIKDDPRYTSLPIIIYTGKELTHQENNRLTAVAETVIIKNAASPQRLLDETALFLHRVEANLPESKRQMLKQVQQHDAQLSGRKILVVDDDMRNIYAISSIVTAHEMQVVHAESGIEALQLLKQQSDIELVLMDIMMPEMDGYEATRQIRQHKPLQHLPVIAVTAKAMKGDREKCLNAGASDYITKPIDTSQLVSLLRVWLYKG